MKKLHSNGHALVQTERTLSFASYVEAEDQTYFYQSNGECLKETSKESYTESMFGANWEKILSQLSNPNFPYIESIAKCWVKEAGNSKLISRKEYFNNTFGSNWQDVYEFELIPKNIFSNITNFMTCTIQNETVCLLWPHDIILHFNEHGELVQYISLEVADYVDTLYQICSDGQAIWGVSPTMNTVAKYTFPSFHLEKIYHYTTDKSRAQTQKGINSELHVFPPENELDGLNYPEYISYIDGQLYICDMENNRIVTFNPDNGQITPYISLDSKPFAFLQWQDQFVIQLDTGIYLLDANQFNAKG